MAFEREPRFARAAPSPATNDGPRRAIERPAMVGVACRSAREVFINGRPSGSATSVSCASTSASAADGWCRAASRGWRRWTVKDPVPAYLVSIVDGNDPPPASSCARDDGVSCFSRSGASTERLPCQPVVRSSAVEGRSEENVPEASDQLGEIADFLCAHWVGRRQFLPDLDRAGLLGAR